MIGIALLTLVPGELGGSETYVRGLAAGDSRRSVTLQYRVLLPPVAAECGGGPSGRGGDRVPPRALDAAAACRHDARHASPGPAPRAPRRRRRRPLPADDADPDGAHAVGGVAARSPAPRPAAAVLALRARVPGRRLASLRARRRPGDRDQRVRPRPRGRAARPRPGPRARRSTSGSTTTGTRPGDVAREPFLLYPARRWPHKNHERLFEAFALLRRERPELRLVLTGGGHSDCHRRRRRGARIRHGGRARRSLPARRRARLPVAVRGVRPARRSRRWRAAAPSPARTQRRCRRSSATPRVSSTRTIRGRSRTPCATFSTRRRSGRRAASNVHASSRGTRLRGAHEAVYRELL